MLLVKEIQEMRRIVSEWRQAGGKVGFVPTMGYFHRGHLTLMERARAENDYVVVSLFVNPTQFGPGRISPAIPGTWNGTAGWRRRPGWTPCSTRRQKKYIPAVTRPMWR